MSIKNVYYYQNSKKVKKKAELQEDFKFALKMYSENLKGESVGKYALRIS
jgi:hypothetical protein